MRVPLSWLKEFVDISVSPESLADRMTMAGLEVERIDHVGENWDPRRVFVAEVVEVKPHPRADRLTVARVLYGPGKTADTVTGAPNVKVGDRGVKVVIALPGASFVDPESDGQRTVVLKPVEIRGVHSEGMLCSERELGLSEDHRGAMILDPEAPVGMPVRDYLGDVVLELDLTPNLGRCLSIMGVAREVAALTGERMKELPSAALCLGEGESWACLTDEDPARATTSYVEVVIDHPEVCSRYSASLIREVTIQPSPKWMQNRLRLAGMRPVNNVVDVTNYCMWEWGQPLHAFDYEEIRGRRILVRQARKGEEVVTLDGVLRKVAEDDLLIADSEGPIAVAGVMGGLDSEVTERARTVLLESANFNLVSIRRTVQALRLPSEASLRFGKGIDPELTIPTLKRASVLVGTICGASVCREIADAYPVKAQEKVIHLNRREVKRILGMDFSLKKISDILESLSFRCEEGKERGTVTVTVPTHRLDVSIPADLIEEISRIHGYDKIPTTLLEDILPPQRGNPYLELEERVRDTLVGCGLTEVITYAMTSMESVAKLDPDRRRPDPSQFIRLLNPVSPDKAYMRQSLLPGVLEAMSFNSRVSDQMMFYEMGRVYMPRPVEVLPREARRLTIALSGPVEKAWWMGSPERGRVGFFHLKGILEVLFDRIGIASSRFEAARYRPFHPGKTAVVRVDQTDLGFLGELHPEVQRHFDLPEQAIVAAELDLEALFERRSGHRYQTISPFPTAKEDLAVVLEEEIAADEIVRVAVEAGRPLVREAAVFDVWAGEQIPPGKKSVAFSLTYQAEDRVLTADEIKETRDRIVSRLSETLGARLRE